MPRVLLAGEGGSGRGHILALKAVAEALGDRFTFDAAICRLEHAAEIAPLCERVFRGPTLQVDRTARDAAGKPVPASWGEFLGDCGLRDTDFLRRQITNWQTLMRDRDIALVVADFAPMSTLAARGLGIPVVSVGIGFASPPAHLESFPDTFPEWTQRVYSEPDMVRVINAAAEPLGVPPLTRLPQLYEVDVPLVTSFAQLDPFAADRLVPRVPPVTDIPGAVASGGDEVFVYFSNKESQRPSLLDALTRFGAPTRIFAPGLPPEVLQRIAAAGVMVETGPVAIDLIASRTRLMLHSGQHGITSLCLAAGIPHVAVPRQLEHIYNGRASTQAGIGQMVRKADETTDRIVEVVTSCYGDDTMKMNAVNVATRVRSEFPLPLRDVIRERLDPLLT